MDLKTLLFLIAGLLMLVSYFQYFKSLFAHQTKPHAFTWLVWAIAMSIGAAGVWVGGGGLPAITFSVGALVSFVIFLLSFKYGTRDITRGDIVALIAAFGAILMWVILDNPLWSVIMSVTIDIVAYWPTVRKTFVAPWSESLSAWVIWVFVPLFSILALDSINALTVVYYGPLLVVNILFALMIFLRRKRVPKPV